MPEVRSDLLEHSVVHLGPVFEQDGQGGLAPAQHDINLPRVSTLAEIVIFPRKAPKEASDDLLCFRSAALSRRENSHLARKLYER